MGKKRVSAQITVYAALIFTMAAALICTCVKSCMQSALDLRINMASRLAVEAAFANYSKELLEEFDIFAVKDDISMNNCLRYFAATGINDTGGKAEYVNSCFEDKIYMTDANGASLRSQVNFYMKLGSVEVLLEKVLGIEKESKKAQKLNEITNEIMTTEEKLVQTDKVILEVIELVEGIKTDMSGIVIRNGKAVPSGEYFAKSAVMGELSMKNTAIASKPVYDAVLHSDKCINAEQLICDLKEDIELIGECISEDVFDEAQQIRQIYERNYKKITELVTGIESTSRKAVQKLENYSVQNDDCRTQFESCINKVKENSQLFGDELSDTMSEDIQNMQNAASLSNLKMCNVEFMRRGLSQNLTVITKIKSQLKKLKLKENISDISHDDLDSVYKVLQGMEDYFAKMDNKLLKFDYSGIDFDKCGAGYAVINKLKEIFSNGISELVLPCNVSDKEIAYTNLAASLYSENKDDESGQFLENGSFNSAMDKLIFNEYLIEKFPCYTDVDDSNESWCELEYPVEYILCGENSDVDNINEVILKLSAIREGVNMAYLITDRAKKAEAMALAATLSGFTGNPAIVKAVQYVILGLWAYGESIYDLQRLFAKESIPALKTGSDWKLSLSDLLELKFGRRTDGNGGDGSSGESGLIPDGNMDYEDYIRTLLFLQDNHKKSMNTLSAMELRMIALGKSDFRMKNYVCKATGVINVKLKNSSTIISRRVNYGYY